MPKLPALDRMFITAAWLQSIIYGVNCVLFGVCMYAIFRKKRAHWIIPLSCIYHFSIATVHNIISLIYALRALTNPAVISVPDGSTLYFARVTVLSMTMIGLYIFNVVILHLLLIWRLYLVWDHNLILAIAMLILEIAHFSTGIGAWAMAIRFGVVLTRDSVALLKADLAFNIVLTVCLTSLIAYRLWRAGKDTFGLTGHNAYKPAVYTIIQCGAIYTSSIVVVCALHLSGSRAGVMADYVGIQFATLTPLLLIATLSLGMRLGERDEAQDIVELTFAHPVQVNIAEEIHTCHDDTMDPRPIRRNQSLPTYSDTEKEH
ncbi:hypothetical protein DFJ58DRAFT_770352 [Suillus subalutaceus]|uniref:uncharacterized protein n=1 Tax=Suillus subalutaceus TaxID=48586 RepID=UPI001B8739D9|nr:uncharacterized protein DFJ58DRAFT_770352 [Suillus subalutaceus]KAG1865806.1 hypothetical protein DFJ58DRAFT_770352 [Suillus subalutaceus]